MTLRVLVKLKRKEAISWDGQQLIMSINAAPIKGAANRRLEQALAEWLDLAPSLVAIQKGHTSRHKTIIIDLPSEKLKNAIQTLPKYPKQTKLV